MSVRNWSLAIAAVVGFGIAVVAVMNDEGTGRVIPAKLGATEEPLAAGAQRPFAQQVVGSGVVEAGSGNIAVGTPVSGIVSAVAVTWGQHVEQGAILFRLDDRDLRAALPLATARTAEAEARLAKSEYELQVADRMHQQRFLSDEQYRLRRFDTQADRAAVAVAKAEAERIRVELDRRVIRASVAGTILQVNTRPGEFAESGVLAKPLMVLGDDARLRVRVDIDENDAPRIKPGARAIAVMRGRTDLRVDLKFESIEPYVVPKASLTGSTTERVDTRVLQVIYSFDPASLPVYVGQQLDVFIEAAPLHPSD